MNPMEELREQAAKTCKGIADGAELVSDSEEARIRHEGIVAGANACAVAVSNILLPAPVALPQAGEVEPFAWMLRQSDGKVFWDEDHCIWTHKADAEEAAEESGMELFGVYTSPPTPTEAPTAAAPDDGLMGRYREAKAKASPDLAIGKVSAKALAGILQRGAETQKPRSLQFSRGEFNAEADAEFIIAALSLALSTATGDEGGE